MEHKILDTGMGALDAHRYAGFWVRVGASLIDMLVLIPFYILVFYSVFWVKSLPLTLLGIILSALYKPVLEATKSATFGKMAVDIKVIDEDGGKISMVQSLIRNSPWIISAAIRTVTQVMLLSDEDYLEAEGFMESSLVAQNAGVSNVSNIFSIIMIIMVVFVAFTAKKQGLHDMMAGTYVVEKRT